MNLIERQQWAIDEILALRENGRRAMGYQTAFLNRPWRGMRRIRKQFERDAAKLGYNQETIAKQWQDVKDMTLLQNAAEA